MVDERAASEVRTLCLALRLAYTLCGGAVDLLPEVRFGRESGELVLEVPATDNLFLGETVQRRYDALARSLGVTPVVRRCATRKPALRGQVIRDRALSK